MSTKRRNAVRRWTGKMTAMLVLVTTATVGVTGPASASVLFSEGWESGTTGWTLNGPARDCANGQSSSCSLLFNPACCSTSATATRTVNLGLTTRSTVSFAFYGTTTGGDHDSNFQITLNTGAVTVHTTAPGSAYNNGVQLNSSGYGSAFVGSWPTANTWHDMVVTLDPISDQVTVAAGGGSATLPIPATASSIVSLGMDSIRWSSNGGTYRYDNIVVDDTAPPAQCNDGVDNDGDTKVDFPADTGCANALDNTESPNPQCSDGIDNDSDGKTDYPNDYGCTDNYDNSENPNPQCSDGVDNDGDGKTDYPLDLGCADNYDNTESPNPQCSDGVDNDGDGWTDYPADPGCDNASDLESPNPQCSDGADNDGDGWADYPADPGCDSIADNAENPNPACADGIDNDGDGTTDYPLDSGCSSLRDTTEAPTCPPVAPGVIACLDPGAVKLTQVVKTVSPGPLHHVVGYVDLYVFRLPGNVSVALPCVTLIQDGTTANACGAAGGQYDSRVSTLVDQSAQEPVIGPDLVTVRVCDAELTLTVNNVGLRSAPALTLC